MSATDELNFNDPTAQRLERITTGADPEVVGPMLADILHDPRWLECDVALISGGKSNLTYRVACDAGEVILRRISVRAQQFGDAAHHERLLGRELAERAARSRPVRTEASPA